MSLPVRGAWIEIGFMAGKIAQNASLPVRGAWIEIQPPGGRCTPGFVAPRAGSVD